MTSAPEDFSNRQNRDGSGRLVLIAGLVLGAVAAALIAVILTGGSDDDDTPIVAVPSTRVAVSASQDIPPRTRITRDMLEVQVYDVEDIDPDAFSAISQLSNRVTAREIQAGEVIVPEDVSATAGEGLTFTITEGMRAVSIRVSEVVTAGGNLSPGNHVDIIGFFEIAEEADIAGIIGEFTGDRPAAPIVVPEDATLTFTLLQNVRILAVAQDLPPDARRPSGEVNGAGAIAETEVNEANPRAATVTLEVTPQQAQAMATADLLGTLRLALRPFGDDEIADVTPIILLLRD